MKSYQLRKSQRQEKYAARDLGGYVQPGSGSQDHSKGDVRVAGQLRVECKTTSKSVYHLHLDDLRKIRLEALRGRAEEWVLQVEFQGQAGMSKKLAVLDRGFFIELAELTTTWTDSQIVRTDKKSFTISATMWSGRPLSIIWSSVGAKMTSNYSFIVVKWEDFLALYTKRQEKEAKQ